MSAVIVHPQSKQVVDLVFRNAEVMDGTGNLPFVGDVAVMDDRIVAVGQLDALSGEQEIDATGLVLCPGFIDVHTHDDNALLSDPGLPAKVSQGVTTVVTGNCGISLAPLVTNDPPPPLDLLSGGDARAFCYPGFAEYVAALEASPPAVNAALMVGHTTLRAATMDDFSRPATPAEIEKMRTLAAEAVRAGAIGLSSGLFYPPSRAATMEEVVGVLAGLAGSRAVYATHMRDEGDKVDEALEESFETARRAGVPLIISHHKCIGKDNFGRSVETLSRIDKAKAVQSVSFDVYPYDAGSSVLLSELVEKASRVRISWSLPYPEEAGSDLFELASRWNLSPMEAVKRLQPGGATYHLMDQADVDRILSHQDAMIGSDGMPHDHSPHPRLWGTFPRVLGSFARERGLLSMEEAVRRMTSLAAKNFGLAGRGSIAKGAFADIVLFNRELISDRATYDAPTRPAVGISYVFVNGVAVYCPEGHLDRRPGRVLRHRLQHNA